MVYWRLYIAKETAIHLYEIKKHLVFLLLPASQARTSNLSQIHEITLHLVVLTRRTIVIKDESDDKKGVVLNCCPVILLTCLKYLKAFK